MRLVRSSAPKETAKPPGHTHLGFESLLSRQISLYSLPGPCEQGSDRGTGPAGSLFKFMIKKVTYPFLNILLFDNK